MIAIKEQAFGLPGKLLKVNHHSHFPLFVVARFYTDGFNHY
jgi:hypothetical protein